jgi:hypothetical protein
VLQVTITGSQYRVAVARLRAYDFRTAGSPVAKQEIWTAALGYTEELDNGLPKLQPMAHPQRV